MLIGLQYRLWVGDSSVAQLHRLQKQIQQQRLANAALIERNELMALKVLDFKTGLDSIEERARYELGMIKKGETFYMVLNP